MTNTTYSTNVRKYNFATAKFQELPKEVFQLDPNTLSTTDRAILDAIKFQITVSNMNNMMCKINFNIMKQKTVTSKQIAEIGNYVLDLFRPILHTSYFILRTPTQLLQRAYFGVSFTIILFMFVSLAYYANVNLNLGMDFLTEIFA